MVKEPANRLVSRSGVGVTADRRRSDRRPAGLRGTVLSATNTGPAIEVTVADMSPHGLGLVSPTPIDIGTNRRVIIHREGTYDLKADARIVSCRQNASGAWEVGAELV